MKRFHTFISHEERIKLFWNNINKKSPTECWEWQKGKNKDGYGQFKFMGRNQSTHRVAFFIEYGEFDKKLCVCHKCDNPTCCNPNHLFLATSAENTQDKVLKGRHKVPCGEKNGQSKLFDKDIIKIRNLYSRNMPQSIIAKLFNLHQSNVHHIVHRKTWGHVL